jgi:hypothetical protein
MSQSRSGGKGTIQNTNIVHVMQLAFLFSSLPDEPGFVLAQMHLHLLKHFLAQSVNHKACNDYHGIGDVRIAVPKASPDKHRTLKTPSGDAKVSGPSSDLVAQLNLVVNFVWQL